MAIKPILFNTEMVRAILEGRKTVTRRMVKPRPEPDYAAVRGMYRDSNGRLCAICHSCAGGIHAVYPPCDRGDILWVRETWSRKETGEYLYKADNENPLSYLGWRPSIHMPREAARIFLRVTGVWVERLQDISEEQAEDEGAPTAFEYNTPDGPVIALDEDGYSYIGFKSVWEGTIKKKDRAAYGWDANPWVWVIEFKRISKEEADLWN